MLISHGPLFLHGSVGAWRPKMKLSGLTQAPGGLAVCAYCCLIDVAQSILRHIVLDAWFLQYRRSEISHCLSLLFTLVGREKSIEMGADALLIDEDTCASNAMIRDRKMMQLVAPDKVRENVYVVACELVPTIL